jgi:hypothetical protein
MAMLSPPIFLDLHIGFIGMAMQSVHSQIAGKL